MFTATSLSGKGGEDFFLFYSFATVYHKEKAEAGQRGVQFARLAGVGNSGSMLPMDASGKQPHSGRYSKAELSFDCINSIQARHFPLPRNTTQCGHCG